jgi:hypothetical protein
MTWSNIFCYLFHIRTSKELPHVLSVHEFKRIICFSVCNQKQSYNEKLYIIPIRTISRFCISRSFARSLELGGTGRQSDAYSGYSAPNDNQRCKLVHMISTSSCYCLRLFYFEGLLDSNA